MTLKKKMPTIDESLDSCDNQTYTIRSSHNSTDGILLSARLFLISISCFSTRKRWKISHTAAAAAFAQAFCTLQKLEKIIRYIYTYYNCNMRKNCVCKGTKMLQHSSTIS